MCQRLIQLEKELSGPVGGCCRPVGFCSGLFGLAKGSLFGTGGHGPEILAVHW